MASATAAKATTPSTTRKKAPAKPKAEAAPKPAVKRATRATAATTAAPKKRAAKPKAVPAVVVETPFDEAGFSEQVARLAYQFWQERGCPQGSPHEDWFRAERELSSR